MTRPEKKQRERLLFNHFASLVEIPAGQLDEGGESPDFVIHGDVTLGIEVTELHVKDGELSWQRQAPRRAEALRRAGAQYVAAGGPAFDFNFDFNPLPAAISIDEIARQALTAATASANGASGEMSWDLLESTPLVRWLYRPALTYAEPRWNDMPCHAVPFLDPVNVQRVVNAKGQKLASYRKCDLQWLVIGVDFWNPAQDQELTWPADEGLNLCGFDRVFIVKTLHKAYLEPASITRV
jgi:hypothetical protein